MGDMKLQRFDTRHLRDFRGPIAVNVAALDEVTTPEEVAPPAPPVFSEEDLNHAREAGQKLGYAEGFEAGLAQANSESTARARDLANSLARIGDQLAQLTQQYQTLVDEQSAELSALVLMIARKVAGEALEMHGTATIEGVVRRCMPMVFGKPRVLIELAPAMLDQVQQAVSEQFEQAGFGGDVEFRPLDGMDEYDMRVQWANGAATRSTAQLWQEIETLLAQVPLQVQLPGHPQPRIQE